MDHPVTSTLSADKVSGQRPALTVWYDGGCPLCIREIAFMRRLDRQSRIAFTDIADPQTACPLDRQLMLARFHATTREGVHISGAGAFAAMWREIPTLRPLGLLARNKVILAALERAYTVFLKVRPALQRLAR